MKLPMLIVLAFTLLAVSGCVVEPVGGPGYYGGGPAYYGGSVYVGGGCCYGGYGRGVWRGR
jgi:hypothetical protein